MPGGRSSSAIRRNMSVSRENIATKAVLEAGPTLGDQDSDLSGEPRPTVRLSAAVAIGILAGAFAWMMAQRAGATPDFAYPQTAARLFLDGQNPYVAMGGQTGGVPPYDEPFFYPFTSVLLILPLARLTTAAASGLFFGASSALLAFFVTRDGMWRLHVFASAPFVVAATLGQFSPLLMAMALNPALSALSVIKPNLGLALFVRRPTWQAAVGAAAFVAISLIVFPGWPADWLESLRRDVSDRQAHRVPLTQIGGFVLLLAAIAWRRAEGRLLLALSVIPQALFFYDQLLLWLIPRTRNESIMLTGASQLAMLLWYLFLDEGVLLVRSASPFIMTLIFLPALVLVLLHVRTPASRATGERLRPA